MERDKERAAGILTALPVCDICGAYVKRYELTGGGPAGGERVIAIEWVCHAEAVIKYKVDFKAEGVNSAWEPWGDGLPPRLGDAREVAQCGNATRIARSLRASRAPGE